MKKITFTHLVLMLIVGLGGLVNDISAQDLSPWTNNSYGNEWIDYNKKYVKIGVESNGIYRVPFNDLANKLKKDVTETIAPSQIQLWRRGKEVAIISADNNWVVFYGERNDGASEGLMFRPGPEARLNPYANFYSDKGSYFFTVASSPSRASSYNAAPSGDIQPEPYHIKKDVYVFSNQFAFISNSVGTNLNNSYYEESNSYTGQYIYGPNARDFNVANLEPKFRVFDIDLKKWSSAAALKPVMEVLVHGLHMGAHNVQVQVGTTADAANLRTVGSIPFTGFGGRKLNAPLALSEHLTPAGQGKLRISSTATSESDWFALTYYTLTYPQLLDMTGSNAMELNFDLSTQSVRRINVTNTPSTSAIYNITNPYMPVVVSQVQREGNAVNMDIANSSNEKLKLLVTAATIDLPSSALLDINFTPLLEMTNSGSAHLANGAINPSAFDYLIVTNDNLKDASKEYASSYRGISDGGSHRTLVVDIAKLYNEFNYGEPSPLAIRRFVNYMLKDGIRNEKHNLLLIGHSVSWPLSGRLIKDMVGEVPTYGDPGSDILLVAGLNGANIDVPAIPVGRINAFQPQEVRNYLAKVKHYEKQTDLSWRKNILHLIGGDAPFQVEEFEQIFTSVSPSVTALDNSRVIKTMSNTGSTVTEIAPITDDVNSGVGMIAYYGHGKQTSTLYDIQYVSRATSPAYTSSKKYPFIYFNGCGVGNVFASRVTHTLATDWLITPDKGAISIIANSYKSYVTPTKSYLDVLYKEIFLKTDQSRRTVGQILVDVANLTIVGGTRVDSYDIANIHQTTLFGDPAVKILNTVAQGSLPVRFASINAQYNAEKSVDVDWSTSWEMNNSHFEVFRSYNGKEFEIIGSVEAKGETSYLSTYKFVDKNPYPGVSYYKVKQVDKTPREGAEQSSFSKIVSVKSSDVEEVIIFPNPSVDLSTIKINDPVQLKSWKLYNSAGKLMSTGTSLEVPTRSLITGQYILEIQTHSGDIYKKKLLRK
jgi:hypothetical protein